MARALICHTCGKIFLCNIPCVPVPECECPECYSKIFMEQSINDADIKAYLKCFDGTIPNFLQQKLGQDKLEEKSYKKKKNSYR